MAKSKEIHFEDEVVDSLTTSGGWFFDKEGDVEFDTGILTSELFAFIGATQVETWNDLIAQMGGDPDKAQIEFRKRLASEIDSRGTTDVLRKGVKGWGLQFDLCYFKPAHGLTPLLVERYEANRLTVTRQQRYNKGHNNTLDVCLWVNGLAVATIELKNQLTGQTVEHAKDQYRKDRDPKDIFLSRRAVVHFAVDPYLVFMTTKLAGKDTRFLPFNRGNGTHAGNPPASGGKHATAYLWEQVLQRDAFLDLFGRFIHTEIDGETGKPTGTIIFPRFHQWDVVRKIEAHAKTNGPGQRYLMEHSAGSGKSNSIAWTAHGLSTLHDAADNPIFDKVIVITDRIVLDDQLSKTIDQFEHVAGVVQRVEVKDGSKSKALTDALNSSQARIIVCTLQTFSFVDKAIGVGAKNYAVIVDEAHSSQTGEAATDLKAVLGSKSEEERLKAAEKVESGEAVTAEDKINERVAARAAQPNLSFFAFTATPKDRTVELFGTANPTTKLKEPFHTYSMRQAVEEKFILDVLRNYTTFDVFWKVAKSGANDPEVEKAKAAAQIAKAVNLHPHNLSQRAKIIVDHFRDHVAEQIGGKAKAMVVTSSRLHAVRYKQAIDSYLADHHITDVKALVAFSGKVVDPDDTDGAGFTESGLNGFPEKETAGRFKGDPSPPFDPTEFQVMIVAEKFQTGFDAPLLHTMYVDKKLEGVNAVQTLARLNRTYPGKDSTFVLDFRNDAETIAEHFRPFYDTTIVEPVDGNTLYTYEAALKLAGVFTSGDVDSYWSAFALVAPNDRKGNGALYSALAPALEKFLALDEEEQEQFRVDLDSYLRAYSFLSQIVTWNDTELEKLYVFAKSLVAVLPKRPGDAGLDLGEEVELTHLRIEEKGKFDASLAGDEPTTDPLSALPGQGKAAGTAPKDHLSAIVDLLNEKHALNLNITDALLFEQFREDWIADADLAAQAKVNKFDNWKIAFDKKFMSTILKRVEANTDLFKLINDNEGFAAEFKALYAKEVYKALQEGAESE